MTAIKICGVRDLETARACAAARVDWIGLNFVKGRRREVSLKTAQQIGTVFPAEQSLAVMRDAPLDWFEEVIETIRPRGIQLHGAESPELCSALLARGLWVVKAIPVDERPPQLLPYLRKVSAFLFDAPTPGEGRAFDWSRLALVESEHPRWLAGGLSSANVQEAIRAARPALVDTASGVEEDGRPSPSRVEDFARAVREEEQG